MIPLAPAGIPIGIHSGYQISRQDSYWNPPGYRWAITREKPAEKLLSQLGKFCKHSVWTSKRKLLGEPKPLVTWLGKSITSKAVRQKGKCDDE